MTNIQKIALFSIHILGDLQALIKRKILKERVWRSFDGRVSLISEMDKDHLLNTYHMLNRRNNTERNKEAITDIFNELKKRKIKIHKKKNYNY